MSDVSNNSSPVPLQQDLFRDTGKSSDDSTFSFENRKIDAQMSSWLVHLKKGNESSEKLRRDLELITKDFEKHLAVSRKALQYRPTKPLKTFTIFPGHSDRDLLEQARIDTSAFDALRGDWQRISDDIRRAMLVYSRKDKKVKKLILKARAKTRADEGVASSTKPDDASE